MLSSSQKGFDFSKLFCFGENFSYLFVSNRDVPESERNGVRIIPLTLHHIPSDFYNLIIFIGEMR